MTSTMLNKKRIGQITAVAFWVAVWFIVAYFVDNKLLVASPKDTVVALFRMMSEGAFYESVIRSFAKILLGFLSGVVLATIFAIACYKLEVSKYIISLLVGLCKSMPVAVFSVVLIIWWGPENLSYFVSMIVVIPVVFNNILEGLKATDIKMLRMASVFKLPLWNKIMFIYRPTLKPYVLSFVKSSIGMSWKAGVAAEVIGLSNKSIGGELYSSKVYFNTDEVFAWAVVIIIVSVLTENGIIFLAKKLLDAKVKTSVKKAWNSGDGNIVIKGLNKAYDGAILYKDYDTTFENGKEYVISQKSGSGKTTLLNMIAGIDSLDSGSIECSGSVSMVFQEDCLCEDYSAIDNVCITGVSKEQARAALGKVLDNDSVNKPCKELSGGMKRRVAIVRAMEYPSDILLLDEPFTGMDEETISVVKKYIEDTRKARTVIVATHIL